MPHKVVVPLQHLDRYRRYVVPEVYDRAIEALRAFAERLRGKVLWNVSSTAAGGGVAELLHPQVGVLRSVGLNAEWMVIDGSAEFFGLTRRLHNALHGMGDWETTDEVRRIYESVLEQNGAELAALIGPGDVVLLHDPQTAGLTTRLSRLGAHVLWRCHIGRDALTPEILNAWDFLAPYVSPAVGIIFTRASYVPPQLSGMRVAFIPPTIDPDTPKNQELSQETVRAILGHSGIIEGAGTNAHRCFTRLDGAPGRVDRFADVIRLGPAPPPDSPLIIQISRWDFLKDPIGVMKGFVLCQEAMCSPNVQLILAGPNVHGVADDPSAASAFNAVLEVWRTLPHSERSRVHLVTLPMADIDENAAIVNALQRHATVIVQKSLHEGFGLTVTEAMWKAKPIVASDVSGIDEQMDDGVHGLLVKDPTDLKAFADALQRMLSDPALALRLGEQARARVRDNYLGTVSMRQLAEYVTELLG
ncbi:MAG: glycosyltransferase [Myxococcaceae bacterium]